MNQTTSGFCETCSNKPEITITMDNFTLEELKKAYERSNQSSYSNEEQAWFYNLYNRVFNTTKQPGCGKCFATVRKQLTARYKNLAGIA